MQKDCTALLYFCSVNQKFYLLTNNLSPMNQISLNTTVSELFNLNLMNLRTYHSCNRTRVRTVQDLIEAQGRRGGFLNFKGCGTRGQAELNNVVNLYYKSSGSTPETNKNFEQRAEETFINDFSSKISETKDQALSLAYQKIIERASVRCNHMLLENFPTYRSIFPVIYMGNKHELYKSHLKTQHEVIVAAKEFQDTYKDIINGSDEHAFKFTLKTLMPFLSDTDLEFILAFKTVLGRIPLFYVLKQLFNTEDNKYLFVINRLYGINGKPVTKMKALAKEMGLTNERVRQISIIRNQKNIIQVINACGGTSNYSFLNEKFVDLNNPELRACMIQERLGTNIMAMYGLIKTLRPASILKVNGKPVLTLHQEILEERTEIQQNETNEYIKCA